MHKALCHVLSEMFTANRNLTKQTCLQCSHCIFIHLC
jgi:hypothetical protein